MVFIGYCRSESTPTPDLPVINFKTSTPSSGNGTSHWLRSCLSDASCSKSNTTTMSNWYEMTETSRFSEGDESIADFSVLNEARARLPPVLEVEKPRTSFSGAFGERDKKESFRRALFPVRTFFIHQSSEEKPVSFLKTAFFRNQSFFRLFPYKKAI